MFRQSEISHKYNEYFVESIFQTYSRSQERSGESLRLEKDTLGEKYLSDDTMFGINTQRAVENFSLSHKKVNLHLIHAMLLVKKAAAKTYENLVEDVEKEKYQAIIAACDELLLKIESRESFFQQVEHNRNNQSNQGNQSEMDDLFVTQALQGGAGTSTNMNVNEVIANIALKHLGKSYGDYKYVHPLDDVNRGQSTNDVYPTALRIASIFLIRKLSDACAALQTSLQEKENVFQDIEKLGRTEWMDAVPITLGEEFGAYAQAIARDRWRIYKVEERLRQVNLGGTAVGLSDNAQHKYRFRVIEELRHLTGLGLAVAEYPMDLTQNNDVFVEVSGLLKALAVNLMKIANDFRIMNSGPGGGIGELRLKAMQQGSTIMPGKVNPVIPEMTMQCAIRIIANDTAITMAAAHGEFELNAFLPLIADSLLESLELAERAVTIFREKCVETVEPDVQNCKKYLEQSYAFATAYTPKFGYETVSKIIKENPPEKAREILINSDL